MEPFSDTIEGVVNDKVTVGATVGVATNTLYLKWRYDTITCISKFGLNLFIRLPNSLKLITGLRY